MKNVTKGEARINPKSKTSVEITETGRSLCTTGGYFYNKESEKVDAENEANALLYLDAHNTYNSCSLSPSELKQQRDELLEALEKCIMRIEFMEQYTEGSIDPYSKKREFRELIQRLSNDNT